MHDDRALHVAHSDPMTAAPADALDRGSIAWMQVILRDGAESTTVSFAHVRASTGAAPIWDPTPQRVGAAREPGTPRPRR